MPASSAFLDSNLLVYANDRTEPEKQEIVLNLLLTLEDVHQVHEQTLRTVNSGLFIKETYGFSYYDSLIVASALESECEVLYSEDLSHNQVINGVLRIVNPFIKAT